MSYLMQNHYRWTTRNPEIEDYDVDLEMDDEYEALVEREYDTRDLSDEGLF